MWQMGQEDVPEDVLRREAESCSSEILSRLAYLDFPCTGRGQRQCAYNMSVAVSKWNG